MWGQQAASSCSAPSGSDSASGKVSPKVPPFLSRLAFAECLRWGREAQPFQPGDVSSVGHYSPRGLCWAAGGFAGVALHLSRGHSCLCPPSFTSIGPQQTCHIHSQSVSNTPSQHQCPVPSYYLLAGHDEDSPGFLPEKMLEEVCPTDGIT